MSRDSLRRSCTQASRSTRFSMGMIKPVSSATGMNSLGGTIPASLDTGTIQIQAGTLKSGKLLSLQREPRIDKGFGDDHANFSTVYEYAGLFLHVGVSMRRNRRYPVNTGRHMSIAPYDCTGLRPLLPWQSEHLHRVTKSMPLTDKTRESTKFGRYVALRTQDALVHLLYEYQG